MDIERVTFQDLVNLNELQLLFENFSIATGFTTGLVDHTTNEVLFGTGWRDICVKFHRAYPESQEHCKASNRELTSGLNHAGEIRIHHCQNGLVDGCTPIIIHGKHFANLFTGQALFAPPDKERFRIQAQQYGYDEQTYLKSLAEVPIVSEERFTAMLRYLAQMVSIIVKTGLANLESRKESTSREALLQSIFRSAPVGIGLVVNRILQWTNERMSEITGYSSTDLKGQTARMLYPSEDEFEWVGREKYAQIKKYGTGSVDTRFKRKDGSIINVHLSSTPIDQQNLTAGVTFTVLDITNRKKDEEKITRAKEEWTLTFDALADIVTIQDKDMRIIRANKAAHQFFQKKYGEMNGKHCYEFFTGTSEPCPGCPLLDTIQDIDNHSATMKHENLGKTFQVSSSSILDENGEIQYLVHVARDITEQKKQEQLLLQISVQQEQLKRFESLKTMAGAIAHRFNNSMMAVLGNLDLMVHTLPAASDEKEMASDALQAAEGASLVGSMMLSYVGQRPLQLEVLSLADLVNESVTELKSQLGSSCSLKFFSPPEPLYCSMDQEQIKEVINNIIMNAIESLNDEAGEIEISFGSGHFTMASFPVAFQDNGTETGMYSFCQVRDTGQGITPENLQRIYEPFFTTKFVGRGLGLALSVGIIRSHHGAVLVESTPSAGTTVRMLLPAIESIQEKVESPVGTKRDSLELSGDILFADDDDSVREVGGNMMGALGFTVHTAVNGLEAVEIIRRQNIDFRAVVLDISMPVMDGIEAMKEIRKSNADIPILLCSGYSEENFPFEKDLTNKPDGFLQKPFQLSGLQNSLEKLLS